MNTKYMDAIDLIEDFNEIGGNFKDITEDSFISQVLVNKEEAFELWNAIYMKEGEAQILKEAIDNFVTIVGFLKILEKKGYDVENALIHVGENNLDKFISFDDPCLVQETIDFYKEQGINVTAENNTEYELTVIKDENGKIRKPVGYVKADVSKFIPKQ